MLCTVARGTNTAGELLHHDSAIYTYLTAILVAQTCTVFYYCTRMYMYIVDVSAVLQGCTQKSIARAKTLVLQEIQDAQSKVEDAQRRDWEVGVKLERAQTENQK